MAVCLCGGGGGGVGGGGGLYSCEKRQFRKSVWGKLFQTDEARKESNLSLHG